MFLAAPVIRTVARIEFPSTKHPMIRARSSVVSLFILTIMLDPSDGITSRGRSGLRSGWIEREAAKSSWTPSGRHYGVTENEMGRALGKGGEQFGWVLYDDPATNDPADS